MKLLISTSARAADHKLANLRKALDKAKGQVVAANADVKRAQKAIADHKSSLKPSAPAKKQTVRTSSSAIGAVTKVLNSGLRVSALKKRKTSSLPFLTVGTPKATAVTKLTKLFGPPITSGEIVKWRDAESTIIALGPIGSSLELQIIFKPKKV